MGKVDARAFPEGNYHAIELGGPWGTRLKPQGVEEIFNDWPMLCALVASLFPAMATLPAA